MPKNVVLLIPAYQPSPMLCDLLRSMQAHDQAGTFCATVVVDDGSGLESAGVFSIIEALPGVTVLRHAVNLGKGAALKTGLNYVLVTFPNAAGAVSADADGQHAVEDILNLGRILAEDPRRITLGVRSFDTGVPLRSRFGNTVTRFIFRAFTGMKLTDTQTGLRAWPRWYASVVLPIPINGYDFELECLLKAHEAGAQGAPGIRQEPIRTIYLDGNRSSHFNPLRDSMRIYFVFLRYCGTAMLAAVVDSLVFYLVARSSHNIAAAQVTGRGVAITMAFVLARNVVFRSSESVPIALAKYLAFAGLMGVISYNILRYLWSRLGIPLVLAKMLAEGLLFVINFSIQREIVFARTRNGKGEG